MSARSHKGTWRQHSTANRREGSTRTHRDARHRLRCRGRSHCRDLRRERGSAAPAPGACAGRGESRRSGAAPAAEGLTGVSKQQCSSSCARCTVMAEASSRRRQAGSRSGCCVYPGAGCGRVLSQGWLRWHNPRWGRSSHISPTGIAEVVHAPILMVNGRTPQRPWECFGIGCHMRVCCTAGKSSQSRPAAGTAADSDEDWDTGKGKGGKGKRGKGGAKGKRGGGASGGGGGRAVSVSNGGVSQSSGEDGGARLLSNEALKQKLTVWCPDFEEGPPELVRLTPP